MSSDLESNASRYIKLLEQATEGIPIWHPSEAGEVGDCGYIHETGRWVKVSSQPGPDCETDSEIDNLGSFSTSSMQIMSLDYPRWRHH
jgi:hypothetical protein